MENKQEKRIVAFIDAENVRNAVEDYGYSDLDYAKLVKFLKKKKISNVYMYVGIEQGDIEKEKRFSQLGTMGYTVAIKKVMSYKQKTWLLDTKCPSCKHGFMRRTYIKDKKKANCDAEMTLDIVRLGCSNAFDQAIVFSGDGDFVKVYEYLINDIKKEVTVYSTVDDRTSSKVKSLHKQGVIKLENIRGLLFHYGVKEVSV